MVATPATKALQAAAIAFTEHPYTHDPRTSSYGLEAAEALGCDPAEVFKTLICIVDTTPVVAIAPVLASVNLKALAQCAGARKARMAEVEHAERLSGYVAGGISPFGQRSALATYVDSAITMCEWIYVSGGRRGFDVRVRSVDLIDFTQATVCDLARPATRR